MRTYPGGLAEVQPEVGILLLLQLRDQNSWQTLGEQKRRHQNGADVFKPAPAELNRQLRAWDSRKDEIGFLLLLLSLCSWGMKRVSKLL
jgi:hypothetical protein